MGKSSYKMVNNEKPICSICGHKFLKVSDLKALQVTHTGAKQFTCELCPKKFVFKNCARRHRKKVHADVQDSGGTCDQCGESSATTQGASVPKRVHSGKKPYRCRLCGEGSSSSNHLKQHMEIHACAHCKQTFVQRRRLVAHSWKIHGSNMVDEEISKRNYENRTSGNHFQRQS